MSQRAATVATDTVGWRDATIPATGVTLGQPGAIVGDADTAAQFDGASTDSKVVSTIQDLTLPHIFSLEAWVRTASSERRADHRLQQHHHERRLEQPSRPGALHGHQRPAALRREPHHPGGDRTGHGLP